MSARFSFAIAEAQQKIQDEAFMDKMGIGDYMTVLASGIKEGLQEKERQELEAEKIKKAEEAELRKKQLAADKLAKEIDATVNLVIRTNGLDPAKAAGLGLTKILKDNGSANASLLQGYIDSIDNIQDYIIGGPPVAVDDQMNMIINPPVFKNPNLKGIEEMDITKVQAELGLVTEQNNPERFNALQARLAVLQSGKGVYKDSEFLSKLNRENIGDAPNMLNALLASDQIGEKQYNRLDKKVNTLKGLNEYKDLSNGDPFIKKNGDIKSKAEIEFMVNDPENKAELTAVQITRGKHILKPPSEKEPVGKLPINQLIMEKKFLEGQAEKSDEEKLRLVNLTDAYDALVAAGQINPDEEKEFDAVKYVSEMSEEKRATTLTLLRDELAKGTLKPDQQQVLTKLEFLEKVDGKFEELDERVLANYSNTPNDVVTLGVTITNVERELDLYARGKLDLPKERYDTYRTELIRLRAIQDAFELENKKADEVSVELTKDFTTIEFKDDPEGSETLVRLTKAGNFYVVSGPRKGQIVDRATGDYKPDSVGPLVGNSVEATSKLANRNDDFFQKLNDKKNDASKLIQSSYELLEFVRQNEGILTIGPMASFAERIMKGTEQFFEIMKNTKMSYSESQIIEKVKASAMAEFEANNKNKSNYSQLAGAYDQWISLSLRHAFQFAKLQLGSSGQALSNMDFKNTLTINNTGSTYEVYGANILRQTEKLLTSESLAFDNALNSDMEHKIGLKDPLYKKVFAETGIVVGGLDNFIKTNNPDAYKAVQDFKKDGTLPPKGPTTVVSQSTATPTALNEMANAQAASDYMNSINANNEYGLYMQGNPNESEINVAARAIAVKAYKVQNPTAEMIDHAKKWLNATKTRSNN